MSVRAKFKVNRIERTMGSKRDGKDESGRDRYLPCEMWTVVMSPVYANNDPEHENSKFWAATPSGEIKLDTVNAEAVKEFDLDKEFYIDFTAAE